MPSDFFNSSLLVQKLFFLASYCKYHFIEKQLANNLKMKDISQEFLKMPKNSTVLSIMLDQSLTSVSFLAWSCISTCYWWANYTFQLCYLTVWLVFSFNNADSRLGYKQLYFMKEKLLHKLSQPIQYLLLLPNFILFYFLMYIFISYNGYWDWSPLSALLADLISRSYPKYLMPRNKSCSQSWSNILPLFYS